MTNKTMLATMIQIATNYHFGQFDKGGNPYILHPLEVMRMVEIFNDEELSCIALGHDLFEDTDCSDINLCRAGMSKRVIDGIHVLTKISGQTYDQYLARIKTNRDAVIVKMADLRHNSDLTRLKGVTQKDLDRAAKYMCAYKELHEHSKLF